MVLVNHQQPLKNVLMGISNFSSFRIIFTGPSPPLPTSPSLIIRLKLLKKPIFHFIPLKYLLKQLSPKTQLLYCG